MPTRYLKDSICSSENIDLLSPFAETVFYRLVVNCDDYGLFDARPKILSSRLYPLRDVDQKEIESALEELVNADLITVYEVDGKPYLHMKSWSKHQTTRAKSSKYPLPSGDHCLPENTDVDTCMQMYADDDKFLRNRNRNRISESGSESGSNIFAPNDDWLPVDSPTDVGSSKKKKEEPVDETPVVIQLMLNDKSMYDIHQSKVDEWASLYPAVDIMQELRNMVGWIQGNPTKRKTKSGILKFVNSWLSKEQNSSRPTFGKPISSVADAEKIQRPNPNADLNRRLKDMFCKGGDER